MGRCRRPILSRGAHARGTASCTSGRCAAEPVFLSPSYHADPGAEYRQFRDLGVDGIFTDFADAAARR